MRLLAAINSRYKKHLECVFRAKFASYPRKYLCSARRFIGIFLFNKTAAVMYLRSGDHTEHQ